MAADCTLHVLAGHEWWFSDVPAEQELAKATCAGCDVRGACLRAALDGDEREGIWGGLSAAERAEPFALIEPTPARIRQRVQGLAAHGTHARYQTCTDGDAGRACRDCLAANARHAAEWRETRAVTGDARVDEDQPQDQFEQLKLLEMTA